MYGDVTYVYILAQDYDLVLYVTCLSGDYMGSGWNSFVMDVGLPIATTVYGLLTTFMLLTVNLIKF